jgi:hypothetical protein
MRKITDFSDYKYILPYASELFGVYQPMLGWKSRLLKIRRQDGFNSEKARIFDIQNQYLVDEFAKIKNPADPYINPASSQNVYIYAQNSLTVKELKAHLTGKKADNLSNKDFTGITKNVFENQVLQALRLNFNVIENQIKSSTLTTKEISFKSSDRFSQVMNSEKMVVDYLNFLHEKKLGREIDRMVSMSTNNNFSNQINNLQKFQDTFNKDPMSLLNLSELKEDLNLTPIGVVHLFRQYFFELDTFLGSPTQHIWLSPGSSVELIEVSTRKIYTEKYVEQNIENITKTENSVTAQDEISESIKENNKNDLKLGFTTTVNQSWPLGSGSATANIDMNKTQETAREISHKRMRQQSQKIATELRNNFKSTFKVITENIDVSSKRYVLNNTTKKLINYELRRKMRQVGVQVQDIGTYLCWNTYLDNAGSELSISELVHFAKNPELSNLTHPETIPRLEDKIQNDPINIPFQPLIPKSSNNVNYRDLGIEADHDGDTHVGDGDGRIFYKFKINLTTKETGYTLKDATFEISSNDAIKIEITSVNKSDNSVDYEIKRVNFKGNNFISMNIKSVWSPNTVINDDIDKKNNENNKLFNQKGMDEFREKFVQTVRERIKLASNIQPRKFEDLREEERIIIYRLLIRQLVKKVDNNVNFEFNDPSVLHLVSEVLNSIFDIDKMLYFVAPDWWQPKRISFSPNIEVEDNLSNTIKQRVLSKDDLVGWGDVENANRGKYFITEDSTPAKLGSSIGWLMQLDGDNLRNAFLNAPWVKTVIPIRPGKEKAALNWLEQSNVEGSDGLDAKYKFDNTKTIRDVLLELCSLIENKNKESFVSKEIILDDSSKINTTPINKVYEHGFYPLQGGFKTNIGENFEIFDQWIEVLPTDQVVAVEVEYDSKTGRQI